MNQDRPLGPPVPGFTPPPLPQREPIEGRWCRLEPFEPARHGPALFEAYRGADEVWDYMPTGPFPDLAAFMAWAEPAAQADDPLFFAVIDREDGRAKGLASYLRITPAQGSIEIGYIAWAPSLQRTRAGTEAMLLFMARAFALGYRRYEWKCNALNAPSRRLAMRLGLSYEGVFRAHMVVKGRNRDSAWYAATEADWPALKAAHEAWLDPANFDEAGRQRRSLSDLTRPVLVATG